MENLPVYLVMLFRRPGFDPAVVPVHMAFLEALREQGINLKSGPFGDKSGGAYLMRAESFEAAQALAFQDPAHTSGGWDVTVHEWHAR